MRPQLFRAFDVGAPSYFILLLTGFVFGTVIAALWARRLGQNPDSLIDIGIAMAFAGVMGARLLHVVADGFFWDYVHLCTDPSLVDWHITRGQCASPSYAGIWDAAKGVCHPPEANCWAWANFMAGGLAYYGGFLGAAPVGWYLCRRDRIPFWKTADVAGFVIPLGLAFGRMGCLLVGCCFGKPTGAALGLSFPPHSAASEWQHKAGLLTGPELTSLPVHPTQIYESALSLAIAFTCLLWVHPRKRYHGQVFLAFIALYSIARFVLEFFRSDDRGGLLGLSTSQLIGVGLLLFCAAAHQRLRPAPLDAAAPAAALASQGGA
ncbi:MAG: prolipoprotein diacylglyceryl transferase [Polyangiaceae bacterium]|nr:prolipoprotein diacylglyceryl transferase [Polyangiaceae bacterium]